MGGNVGMYARRLPDEESEAHAPRALLSDTGERINGSATQGPGHPKGIHVNVLGRGAVKTFFSIYIFSHI